VLKIGYKASAEQFTPSELLQFTCLAEELGFDSAFISDHFQPWRHTNGHAPYSFAWLGAAGARTSRMILGTSVVTPTFRYHPSIVAQAMGTLGSMFPDRVVLGVGTGESLNEVPATGMVWPGFKERFGRLKESIELMNRLWREERVSFEGQYYRTENATIYDRPKHPVPIYIAAAGPTAAALAGEVGDGFICTSGKSPALYSETLLPKVSGGLVAAKRSDDSIDRMIEIKVSYDTDPDRAKHDTRFWAALALTPEEKTGVEDPRADGSFRPIPARWSRKFGLTWIWDSGISFFMRRGRIRRGSCGYSPNRSRRNCGRHLLDADGEEGVAGGGNARYRSGDARKSSSLPAGRRGLHAGSGPGRRHDSLSRPSVQRAR